ncbi:MAG TPA: LysR substrate-binding domain-containing protein [Ramlibacter sp.]|nr:LysR substrate-binding domain-containing protein [Ramlibacter sp.]
MNLQHLSVFHQVVASGFSISQAAAALGMSQPLATRQLQALERRLGVPLFVRSKRRIVALTPAGESVLQVVPRVLQDLEAIEAVGRDAAAREVGELVISTTHTYARHLLPPVLTRFAARFPRVRIALRQGNPIENARDVAEGDAHLSISASEPAAVPRDKVVQIPFTRIDRVIVVPTGHPLARLPKPSLKDLGRYPLVTFSGAFSARTRLIEALERVGVTPNVVLSATDAEVIKTYVRQGMGIAVLSSLSVQRDEPGLVCMSARHLLQPDTIHIGLRRHSLLRPHQMELIAMLAPGLKRAMVEKRLAEPAPRR